MEDTLYRMIGDFVSDLQPIHNRHTAEISMSLPYEVYVKLIDQLEALNYPSIDMTSSSRYIIKMNVCGTNVVITCKEYEDEVLRGKLNKCFKILTDKEK